MLNRKLSFQKSLESGMKLVLIVAVVLLHGCMAEDDVSVERFKSSVTIKT